MDGDGDGLGDLLIGAPSSAIADPGAVYLVLGRSSGWPATASLSTADASFVGEANADLAGSSVAGAGDVDGDGLQDMLVGAIHHDHGSADTGAVYLVLGRGAGWAANTPLGSSDAVLYGIDSDCGGDLDAEIDHDGDGCDAGGDAWEPHGLGSKVRRTHVRCASRRAALVPGGPAADLGLQPQPLHRRRHGRFRRRRVRRRRHHRRR